MDKLYSRTQRSSHQLAKSERRHLLAALFMSVACFLA